MQIDKREDETRFVLEGSYVFEVGGLAFCAHAGDYVFGPRNVAHSYANRSANVARALIMVTGAGFEGFWRESARLAGDTAEHEVLGRPSFGKSWARSS